MENVIQVVDGEGYTIYLKSDGNVYGVGTDLFGQLGFSDDGRERSVFLSQVEDDYYGDYINRGGIVPGSIPVQIPNLENIILIATGGRHSLFLKRDGTVWGCGWNAYGQVGGSPRDTNTNNVVLRPRQIEEIDNVIGIACGRYHSLFLRRDSTVWGCGWNMNFQLGDGKDYGDEESRVWRPVQIPGIDNVIQIHAAGNYSAFLRSDTTVWKCGDNIESPTLIPNSEGTRMITGGGRRVEFLSPYTQYLYNPQIKMSVGNLSSGEIRENGEIHVSTFVGGSTLHIPNVISIYANIYAYLILQNGSVLEIK